MSKKQETIINGIDVSECEYFKNGSCGLETLTPCPYYKDCYFKQLKRLQEENDELKQERLEVARLFDKTCRCDDLQAGTAKCQYFNNDCISIRHCMKKFRSLKDSYKQALKEIRKEANRLLY